MLLSGRVTAPSQSLTLNVPREGFLPTVHLDELYAAQDLVHQSHAPVSHCHALSAEIRGHPGRQHLCRHGGHTGNDDEGEISVEEGNESRHNHIRRSCRLVQGRERKREQLINAFHIRNAVSGRQDSPQTESELKRKQQPVI